jgi:UDP-N-acetylglucosamine 2-epimerase (non-hydrolysing)
MRNNTERPITCEVGSNYLVGNNPLDILDTCGRVLDDVVSKGQVPEKWDGKSAARIVELLLQG